MNNQFENDLNSEKNLKLTLKLIKELNLIKGVPINKRIIDIAPEIINIKNVFNSIITDKQLGIFLANNISRCTTNENIPQ